MKKLRVTFVIPFTVKTGGIAVVLEYYRLLTAMGHEVTVIYPLVPYKELRYAETLTCPLKKAYSLLRGFRCELKKYVRKISHFSEDIPVKPVIAVKDIFMPNADAVIATAWPTAYDVNGLSPKKGRKFYFVQDYETWLGRIERVDNSYRLPLGIITIAPWLTELMKEKFKRNNVTEIRNGIRLDKFYPPTVKNIGEASILFMAHNLESKGTKDALDALVIVKERFPQLKIRAFGMCPRPNASFDFEYHQDPPYEKLLSLYQNTSVFIFPSHGEGWGLTPIEAMACGCALVATDVGCIPLVNDGENMIIAEKKNPLSIAEGVIRLIENEALLSRVAERGHKTVCGMGWEKSARLLADTIFVDNRTGNDTNY